MQRRKHSSSSWTSRQKQEWRRSHSGGSGSGNGRSSGKYEQIIPLEKVLGIMFLMSIMVYFFLGDSILELVSTTTTTSNNSRNSQSLMVTTKHDKNSVLQVPAATPGAEFHPDQARDKADLGSTSQDGIKYHVIFSTGCSPFQDWQSYVFFYHALHSGQLGNVTRIASCPNNKDANIVRKIFKEEIQHMSDRFSLHITPDYSITVKPGMKYKFFNKPFGTLDFLEHVFQYPSPASAQHDDTIVMLLDPDQMIIRPFTNDFAHSTEVWRPTKSKLKVRTKVEHGAPFGQQYGFGTQWKTKVNATYVANGPTRVTTMDMEEAKGHYALGPPYIATARDFYKIAQKWTEFVPRVHNQYPHLLAEMFAYCFAAAHLNLPHRVAHSFMVSDVGSGGEGWKLVDQMGHDHVCEPPPDLNPHVLHYCQRYMLGKWFIGKYRLRKDFISCEAPLLKEPPLDIFDRYDYQVAPDGSKLTFKGRKSKGRNAFMICALIPRLNRAAEFYKKHHCQDGKANFNKTYIFHDTDEDM